MNQKHRTLLRMDDEGHPAVYVQMTATGFDGVRIPVEHLSWLPLKLEMNTTIRENQVNVACHMIQTPMSRDDTTIGNIVMQMSMGEGKTSVIIPMLALSLIYLPRTQN
ncbi:unnamed protein product [Didymodactylos carnosus]|uniref:DUF3638 domain-containing protein n=1 Tax=Didymodactylos carnosus TaxID=1234261 RepID=A0A815BV38_9BILA|nr:unnamed protein product [Didymodactylos carnosus]CAF4066099.1 unnamed protein product [Didymodactylos carnosus]